MRVLFVAPFGLGQKTTVWARTLPLARELVRQGDQVRILIPPWDTPQDAGTRRTVDGVSLVQVALGGGLPAITARMLCETRAFRPHVIHIVKPRAYAGIVQWLVWYSRRVQGAARPRLILDVDDWEQAWSPILGYAWPVARFLDWQERWGIRHADGVTAASRWLVEQVGRASPDMPVCYLPNGVEPPASWPEELPAPEPPRVLLFSRFVETPPEWMGRFWQALAARHPDVRLRVIGRALQPEREAAFRAALGADPRVEWQGPVTPDVLAAIYREVTCAVFPATPTPLNMAKCSVRLATTLLHGVPVVASAVGEQAHYGAEGAAWLVPATASPETFADAVARLLVDVAARAEMVRRARERLLREYAWPRLGARLRAFYAQVAGGNRRGAEREL